MSDLRPGLNPRRLLNLMQAAIERCHLNLCNAVVLTEAASGAYVVTPVMAAMAGAKHVFAFARSTRYGTVEEITAETLNLARLGDVKAPIEVVKEKKAEIFAQADIITNSGHLRPIDAETVSWMKPTAVIPLMYEAWEVRPKDIDLDTCRRRDIPVAGTNERHPAVDIFSFLGMMAINLLLDARVSVYMSNVLLLCDNPFASFIERGLVGAGARVDTFSGFSRVTRGKNYDAILVALQPRPEPVLSAEDAAQIAGFWPGAVVAQFWGDIDRSALLAADVPVWPAEAPVAGHLGILPSAIGPEPVARLQAGGLKVGEILWQQRRAGNSVSESLAAVVKTGYGMRLK